MSRIVTTHLGNQKCIGLCNIFGGQCEGKILLGRTSGRWGMVLSRVGVIIGGVWISE
jgi:hypothetical protein